MWCHHVVNGGLLSAGEALNIDLSDFVTQLYGMILPLSLMGGIESSSSPTETSNKDGHILSSSSPALSISDLLFRALRAVFSPRIGGAVTAPPWRSAAFSKRLLTAALHWPPTSALRALNLIHDLIAKNPKLEALLSTEDDIFDGIYHADVDDPQLCHPYGTAFWELWVLATYHMDCSVRITAEKLLNYSSASTS